MENRAARKPSFCSVFTQGWLCALMVFVLTAPAGLAQGLDGSGKMVKTGAK
jgi:ABC-type arginine/histidine transport system permease subunit